MKFKKITLKYKESLTACQEKLLIVNVQAIKNKAVATYRKQTTSHLSNMITRERFRIIADVAESGITLCKSNVPGVYQLTIPTVDLTGFENELNKFGMKGINKVLPIKRLINFLTGPVAKDMGIAKHTITWEEEEVNL
jgi:hypothetical protein